MFTFFRLSMNACRECLREPVYYLMLVAALIMIGLFPYFAMFVFRQQIRLVCDSSMATTLLFGLFAAVLCSARTISREMKNGTVLLLMSKPVSRFAFVISKVGGILASLTIFVLVCNSATWLSILIAKDQFRPSTPLLICYFGAICLAALFGGIRNFISQKSFSSGAVVAMAVLFPVISLIAQIIRSRTMSDVMKADPESFIDPGVLLPALCMLFFAVWIMGVISSALATRMEIVGNLMVCLILFLIGMVLHYFAAAAFGTGSVIALLCTSLVPNWQLFWMADALSNRVVIPVSYFAWTLVYSVLYAAAWTGWAFFLFQDSELARDTR
ncbi:MAG: ABC transporter permease [Lentisphaeria bacterium]|jgi:ABC-type transport system involved in multi-copper enzyme maturation permease subunit|nr:ABC transporter permease [Lentisphaeria bacterium]